VFFINVILIATTYIDVVMRSQIMLAFTKQTGEASQSEPSVKSV